MKLTDFLQDVGRPIAYYPSLRKITGSTNATIFLCQLLYWKGKEADPEGWIYKTTEQMEDETGLSYEEQKTARNKLKQAELIEEHYARLDHQMKYRPNTEAIDEKWRTWQSLVREEGNPALGNEVIPHSLKGITETTTETTSQIKEFAADAAPPMWDRCICGHPLEEHWQNLNKKLVCDNEGCLCMEYEEYVKPVQNIVTNGIVRDYLDCGHTMREYGYTRDDGSHWCKKCNPLPPPRRAKITKPRDPRLDHPVIVAYRDAMRLTPPEIWRDDMVTTITDIEKWKDILKSWLGKSFKPGNIEGLLDVYRHGWKQNGRAPKPAQPEPPRPTEADLDALRADVAAKVKERDAKRKAGFREVDEVEF